MARLPMAVLALLAGCCGAYGTDLRGEWSWTCCGGRHDGTFQILVQNADGSFSGRFGDSTADGKSPMQGRITPTGLEFQRTILPGRQIQNWTSGLSASGATLRMTNGRWSGFGGSGEFQATRKTVEPAAGQITGKWNWTCCGGAHRGTFTIAGQTPDGKIHGIFGNGPSEGTTPLDGTFARGEIVFTRHLKGALQGQQQVWRATVQGAGAGMRMANGRWSGYAAGPNNTDFQATFAGAR
jgi:hypothetical protein